jgi:hypothetical protein
LPNQRADCIAANGVNLYQRAVDADRIVIGYVASRDPSDRGPSGRVRYPLGNLDSIVRPEHGISAIPTRSAVRDVARLIEGIVERNGVRARRADNDTDEESQVFHCSPPKSKSINHTQPARQIIAVNGYLEPVILRRPTL